MTKTTVKAKPRKAQKKSAKRPAPPAGWLTTDVDEIERRRLRGANNPFHIEPRPQGDAFYGAYQGWL
jgi:hypothetical protein